MKKNNDSHRSQSNTTVRVFQTTSNCTIHFGMLGEKKIRKKSVLVKSAYCGLLEARVALSNRLFHGTRAKITEKIVRLDWPIW